jgi:class 3 adenylate cyclase
MSTIMVYRRDGTRPRWRGPGIAVHTGTRVAPLAGAGEILVSRTIRDLVADAPVRLESRGTHDLKGVPGPWEIFAVVG